jgi:acetyltransferase
MRGYPDGYEISTTTKKGLKILIRPMRRDDGPRLKVLFSSLSPKSIYFRFFMPLKALSDEMLDSLTQIDHDQDLVLVAAEKTVPEERILGVFRLMRQSDGETGELAIVVGDPWQGKGVAAKLFEHGLFISKEKGFGSVCGMVMAENKTVLALARRLGFETRWDSEAHAFELRMDLKSIDPKHLIDSLQKEPGAGQSQ